MYFIETKYKIISDILEFNQSQWLKPYTEFNTQTNRNSKKTMTKIEKRKNEWTKLYTENQWKT